MAVPGRHADLRGPGLADRASRREPDGQRLFGRVWGAAERNGAHVPIDERVPLAALAEADLWPTRRCRPVLTGGRRRRVDHLGSAITAPTPAWSNFGPKMRLSSENANSPVQ